MRRVREDLSALFGSIGRPGISTLVSWGCAVLAYPLAARGGYAGAVGGAIVFSLAVLFLACLLGSGALAFAVDAKRSCLPGSRRLARRASLLATVLLLPELVLTVAALAGNPVWPAWVPPVLVLAIALAGVLAGRRPTAAGGLLLLVVLTACWAASGRGDHERGKEWFFALLGAAIVLLAAALPGIAAVNWRRVMGRRVMERGSRPPSLASTHASGMTRSQRRGWQRPHGDQIIRTCLGGMFVQRSRLLLVGAVLLAAFIAAGIGLPWLGASGGPWTVAMLALAAGALISSGFLTQISKLTRAQMAELALIPGLGVPAAQRRALCGAVLTPPLVWLGVVLLLGSTDLLLEREPLSSVSMLAMCLIILWLGYAVFALQKLATLPAKRQSFISEFLLLYLVLYASGSYCWLYAAHPQVRLWFWFWITPALLSIGIASAIGLSIRRLALAPHPFIS